MDGAALPKGLGHQKKQVSMMRERRVSSELDGEVVTGSRPDSARSRKDLQIKVNTSKGDTERLLHERRESSSRLQTVSKLEVEEEQNLMEESKDEQILDLDYIEKMWAIQDKWQLISWGLRQRQALLFRKHFLEATENLKDRFRIVVSKFLQKRAERQFEDIKNLILNFDKDEPKKTKKTDIKKGQVNTDVNNFDLAVIEEQDDLDESNHFDSNSKANFAFKEDQLIPKQHRKVTEVYTDQNKPGIKSVES